MSSHFGKVFTVTTWGESHGPSLGAVIDGCPPNLNITVAEIQAALDRRKPGQNPWTSSRQEADRVSITSGIFEGKTMGSPIGLTIANTDAQASEYKPIIQAFRPSHADYTYWQKYNVHGYSGGGRASARETAARVAAGAIAHTLLQQACSINIRAYVEQVHTVKIPCWLETIPSLKAVDTSPIRCPHPETATAMLQCIEAAQAKGDSVGGVIVCRIQNVPVGLGEPVFDKLEALLAQAMLSIPAAKGFEIGSGFKSASMFGSEHNDLMYIGFETVCFSTNHSGGVQGGISNGAELYFRVAFKPPATIAQPQKTITKEGQPTTLIVTGRHDPCVVARAVPIVEAMAALVLADQWLQQQARKHGLRNI